MARPKKIEHPTRADGRWEYKTTVGVNADGTPIRKSFFSRKSYEDAQAKANAYKVEQAASRIAGVAFQPTSIAFDKWAREWLDTYVRPEVSDNTYRLTYANTVEGHLIPFFGRRSLNDILPADIKRFYVSKRKYSVSMLGKMRMCLNAIFDVAVDNDLCRKNPARRVKFTSAATKSKKRVYSDALMEHVKQLALEQCPEVYLFLETGVRRGELCGFEWDDFKLNKGTYKVSRSVADVKGGGVKINPPKWSSYRENPLTPEAVAFLRGLPRTSKYVFPGPDGGPQRPNVLTHKVARFMSANMPEDLQLTPHELRHTYGTWLYRHHMDIFNIQRIMGHKDIRVTTEIYVHNDVTVLQWALQVVRREAQKKTG